MYYLIMNEELKITVNRIRENPEEIEKYLITQEDKEYLMAIGFVNFVNNCDDAEIIYILEQYNAQQGNG